MNTETLKRSLCNAYCSNLQVVAVPVGISVSTGFILPDGDPADFYVIDTPDGMAFEDDGDFIATAIASGIHLDAGTRGKLLDGILSGLGAYLDRDTCQIKSGPFPASEIPAASLRFISALIRVRDLLLLTQDQVASTFAEDVRTAMEERFGADYSVKSESGVDNPADVVLTNRATGEPAASVYAANSNEKLLSAMLRHKERKPDDAPVIAVLDSIPSPTVSTKRFMMAQNRGLHMPFFKDDPTGAMEFIADHLKIPA